MATPDATKETQPIDEVQRKHFSCNYVLVFALI